jgi:hypothetical protein
VNTSEQQSQQPVHNRAQPAIAQLLPAIYNMQRIRPPAQEFICKFFLAHVRSGRFAAELPTIAFAHLESSSE